MLPEVFLVNRNNYQLGSNDFILNEKADDLMNNICFLGNERVYAKRFPLFSTIKYDDIDEDELIMHIEELEKLYSQVKPIHHHAHLYVLSNDGEWFHVYPNDTQYGTEPITSAPVSGGRTALEALVNAWKIWSIPPVLVLNSNHYCPNVSISTILKEVDKNVH